MTEQTLHTAEEVEALKNAERANLLAQAGALGITTLRKNASNETIRQAIERHMVAQAQADVVKAAQEDIRARQKADTVQCRITKKGDQKVSKGIHIPGRGDLKFAWRDVVMLDRKAALVLEDRGFVEIEDAEHQSQA